MTLEQFINLKPGDRIKFKLHYARWYCRTETHIVKEIGNGGIYVRYAGYSDFFVKPIEVIEVYKKQNKED